MRSGRRIELALVAALSAFLLFVIASPADAYTTVRITEDAVEDALPDTDGRYVAWQRHDGQDYEIMLYDAVTEETVQITDNAVDDEDPRASNGRVLFRHGNSGLYLYENGSNRPLVAEASYGDIEGHYVTYSLGEGNSSEVYALNVENGVRTRVTDNSTRDYAFKLLDGRVYFHHYAISEREDFTHYPIAHDIATGERLPFTQLWLYDDSLIDYGGDWAAYGAGFETGRGVALYNGRTEEYRTVVDSGLAEFALATDGRQVVWPRGSEEDSDLGVYDIASRRFLYLTDTPGLETHPAVENNAVAWTADEDVFLATAWDLSPGDFPDVPREGSFVSTHPFYEEITGLAEAGFVSGFADGLFHSAEPLRRAQYAKIIVNVLGLHDEEWANWDSPSFSDVGRPATQEGSRYPFDYVEEAKQAGIVQGKTAELFAPWDDITRVQLALMVARAGEEFLTPGSPEDLPFRDLLGLSEEARQAIATCYANGITDGTTETNFSPHGRANRGQAAKMTWRLYTQRP